MIEPRYYRYDERGEPQISTAGMSVLAGLENQEIIQALDMKAEDFPQVWVDRAITRLEALHAELSGDDLTMIKAIDIFCARESLPMNTQPRPGEEPVPDIFAFYIGGPLDGQRLGDDPDDRYVWIPFIWDDNAVNFSCWVSLDDPLPPVKKIADDLAAKHGFTTEISRAGELAEFAARMGIDPAELNGRLEQMRPQLIAEGVARYDANGNFVIVGEPSS